jgi:polyhydroxybutyrate depolymerase
MRYHLLLSLFLIGCGRQAPAPAPPSPEPERLAIAPKPVPEPAIDTKPPVPTKSTKPGKVGVFPDQKIQVKDKERLYRLVVPKSVDPNKAAPLVFAFHGLFDGKDLIPRYSQLPELAEAKGFIVVFPNGLRASWPLVLDWARDDLAFFDTLLEHLEKDYTIDADRVFLTGMSNGAYFSHLVASQRADRIAAVAAHSGGLGLIQNLSVKHKYPVMLIHGDADSIVNVSESRKARDAYEKWGHEVKYVEIPKHNHFWAAKQGINEQIWAFFKEHPRLLEEK